jgi:hypothetical protein
MTKCELCPSSNGRCCLQDKLGVRRYRLCLSCFRDLVREVYDLRQPLERWALSPPSGGMASNGSVVTNLERYRKSRLCRMSRLLEHQVVQSHGPLEAFLML